MFLFLDFIFCIKQKSMMNMVFKIHINSKRNKIFNIKDNIGWDVLKCGEYTSHFILCITITYPDI